MVPKFDEFMYPALEFLRDGRVRTNKEIYRYLTKYFNLSKEDLAEDTNPEKPGVSRALSNMSWALTFLFQAGLTQKEKRGYHQISDLGLDLLNDKSVTCITESFLIKNYGKDIPFFNSKPTKPSEKVGSKPTKSLNPDETAKAAITQINEAVASDLLNCVQKMNPERFEGLVVELLVKMGYGGSIEDAASVTQYSKDEGIDGVIKEDLLGLDTIYLQAKRWKEGSTVGRKEIQAFVGALMGKHATKGVFITTSQFTNEAVNYVKETTGAKIILIDGRLLCRYMMKFNLGVTTKEIYEIKRIDSDYFEEE